METTSKPNETNDNNSTDKAIIKLTCPRCSYEENRSDALFCPECGYNFNNPTQTEIKNVEKPETINKVNKKNKYWIIALSVITLLIINFFIISYISKKNSNNSQTENIINSNDQGKNEQQNSINKENQIAEDKNRENEQKAEQLRIEKEKADRKKKEEERIERERQEEEAAEQRRIEEEENEKIRKAQEAEDELKERIEGFYSGFGSNYQIVSAKVKVVGEDIKVTSGGRTFMLYSSGNDIFYNEEAGLKCVFNKKQLMFQNAEGTVFYLTKK